MKNHSYKVILAYDGTSYFGWQKTKEGPSIQEELEKAIFQLSNETILPEAASRTDRGVHAEGQAVQFALAKEWPPDKLRFALNAVLPNDIRVKQCEKKIFHPTLDAKGKEYRYRICQGLAQDPTLRLYSWHFYHSLDRSKIETAIQDLLGTHDFTAFANEPEIYCAHSSCVNLKDGPANSHNLNGRSINPICTLESITFDGKEFQIQGDRFLYKMVRNLVGTLLYIGCGKLFTIPPILASKDRRQAGITAPAHGLYLHQVIYGVK